MTEIRVLSFHVADGSMIEAADSFYSRLFVGWTNEQIDEVARAVYQTFAVSNDFLKQEMFWTITTPETGQIATTDLFARAAEKFEEFYGYPYDESDDD